MLSKHSCLCRRPRPLPSSQQPAFLCGSTGLVPGDIVEFTGRATVPCDMVLVQGSVEVDESAITGDASTQFKGAVPLRSVDLSSTNLDVHTLYHGSRVLSAIPSAPDQTVASATAQRCSCVLWSWCRSIFFLKHRSRPWLCVLDSRPFAVSWCKTC